MLRQYFEYPRVFQGLESAIYKSYLESFAEELGVVGYAREHIRNQLRAAAHLCVWAEKKGIKVADFGEEMLARFRKHLPRCQCSAPAREKSAPVTDFAGRFVDYLGRMGAVAIPAAVKTEAHLNLAFHSSDQVRNLGGHSR